jgi:hypothetical protein
VKYSDFLYENPSCVKGGTLTLRQSLADPRMAPGLISILGAALLGISMIIIILSCYCLNNYPGLDTTRNMKFWDIGGMEMPLDHRRKSALSSSGHRITNATTHGSPEWKFFSVLLTGIQQKSAGHLSVSDSEIKPEGGLQALTWYPMPRLK